MHILIEVESTTVAAKIEELLKEYFGAYRLYEADTSLDPIEKIMEIGIDGGEA